MAVKYDSPDEVYVHLTLQNGTSVGIKIDEDTSGLLLDDIEQRSTELHGFYGQDGKSTLYFRPSDVAVVHYPDF